MKLYKILIILLIILYIIYDFFLKRKKNTFNYFRNSLKYKRLFEKKQFADKYYARNYVKNNYKDIYVFPLIFTTSNPKDLLKIKIIKKLLLKQVMVRV